MARRAKDPKIPVQRLMQIADAISDKGGRLRYAELKKELCTVRKLMKEPTLCLYLRKIDAGEFSLVKKHTQMRGGLKESWYYMDADQENTKAKEFQMTELARRKIDEFDTLYSGLKSRIGNVTVYTYAFSISCLLDIIDRLERGIIYYRDTKYAPNPIFKEDWDKLMGQIEERKKRVHVLTHSHIKKQSEIVSSLVMSFATEKYSEAVHVLRDHVIPHGSLPNYYESPGKARKRKKATSKAV